MQFDLFDQEEAKGAGERQTDLEEVIAFEDSLYAKIQNGDENGVDELMAKAKAGEVIRLF